LAHLLEHFGAHPKIENVFLFGSCAKGVATQKSDLDLFLLGSEITDEDEFDIVWNCPQPKDEYVSCDILSSTHEAYLKMSKIPGMVQHSIELRGIDISELLPTS
jgi:hypothetical protein